jgi:hypothetical protein
MGKKRRLDSSTLLSSLTEPAFPSLVTYLTYLLSNLRDLSLHSLSTYLVRAWLAYHDCLRYAAVLCIINHKEKKTKKASSKIIFLLVL